MIIMSVGEDYQNYIGKINVVSFKSNLEVLDFARVSRIHKNSLTSCNYKVRV